MKNTLDDIFILRLIKAGNEQAFKHLFEMYFAPLCRFVYIYVKDGRVAEEISLDVFTSFWERREMLKLPLTIKAYLFQSARNRSLNYVRDNRRLLTVGDLSSFEQSADDQTIEMRELERLLSEAILSLPSKCRYIFEKSRMENMTNKEIAASLNITVKAVEAHITRALKHIKNYLGDSYHYLW